ncbi:MAG TPA: helix-turn-helix domain-containing protein [Kofleriaceae bacterium]|jgi:AcrR family transcriptional regulator
MNLGSSTKKKVRPLRERVRDAVSGAILDAAEEIIAERGVYQAAMSEIAARAGVAVGTVYNHFADRDSLLRELFRARRALISPEIVRLAEAHRSEPFEPRLRGLVADVLALLERHRRFVKVALEAEQIQREPTGGPARPVMTSLQAATAEVLAAGAAGGRVRAGDVDRLVRLLLGSMRGMLRYRLDAGGPFTDDADLVVDVFLRGAAPPAAERRG